MREMGAQWSTSTQGRVTLRIYPGGIAGDEPDVVRKMRLGQLQASAVTTAGLASIDPAFHIFNIPMFFSSYPELYATLEALEPILKKRLEDKGFMLISWGHGGWVYFFTKAQVADAAGLKKTKMFVWAGDEQMVQQWKTLGFQPVALAATDIMQGLQTNMIDSYPSTPLIGLTLQWYRQTPNLMALGLAPLVGGLVVNKAVWMKISEADRQKIQASCHTMEERLKFEVPKQDTTAVNEMQKRGLKVNPVKPADVAVFSAIADQFAAGIPGSRVPPEILAIARKARDDYRKRAGTH
jgi:TRAP-type C4-dicarboxylate transport system substrate-binding protein